MVAVDVGDGNVDSRLGVAFDPTAVVAVLPFLCDAMFQQQNRLDEMLARPAFRPATILGLVDYPCTFFSLLNIANFIPPLCLKLQNVLNFLFVHKIAPKQIKTVKD